ncbi:beta-lactamase/transpeptidase-like protein [Aspergillus venezuelensis]
MLFILLFILAASVAATPTLTCPLAGPVFLAPKSVIDSTAFRNATADFTNELKKILRPANGTEYTAIDPDLTSFTVQVYSAHDQKPLFEYYNTATSARNNTIGVNRVDENTVFRVGSVSKLWAVLVLLMESGDSALHEPVYKYIPELEAIVEESKWNDTLSDDIDNVRWEEITIGELASQMAGLERSYGLGDRATNMETMMEIGFPELKKALIPKCGLMPACERDEYFEGPVSRHPVVPSSSSPVYSNDAYQLLGYVIEEMAGDRLERLVNERLIERLNLTRSSYTKPDDSVGIIPGPINQTAWDTEFGDLTPTGGIYSSTKDLSTLGRAILNHDLLSPALTRRWMKPVARTADRGVSVGTPFEIYHLNEPRAIDLFTKSGDIGAYSALVGLSPDHNIGVTVFAAGERTTPSVAALGDLLSTIIISGIEEAAKEEATHNFAGTYSTKTNKLTIATDDGPGLRITEWTNRGKDMLEALATLQWVQPEGELDVRLYPTGLKSRNKISFRAIVTAPAPTGPPNGPMTNVCVSWLTVDSPVYGSVAVDEFVFEIGQAGKALTVTPRALRTSLRRDTMQN